MTLQGRGEADSRQTGNQQLNSAPFGTLHQGNGYTIPNDEMSHEDFRSKKDIFAFLLRYLVRNLTSKYMAENVDPIEVEYPFSGWNLNQHSLNLLLGLPSSAPPTRRRIPLEPDPSGE
jgi:hypothetical protein